MLRDVRIAASRDPKLRPDRRECDDVSVCLLEGMHGGAGSKSEMLDCGSAEGKKHFGSSPTAPNKVERPANVNLKCFPPRIRVLLVKH